MHTFVPTPSYCASHMLLQLQLEWRKDCGHCNCSRLFCYRVRHPDLQLLPGSTPQEGIRELARELDT